MNIGEVALSLNSDSLSKIKVCTDKNGYSDSLSTAINLTLEMAILLSSSLCSRHDANCATG